jgi:hypothetical protein
MAEAGFPEIECDARIGFLAPVGTPRQIVALLNREIGNIVAREGAAGQVRIRAVSECTRRSRCRAEVGNARNGAA